MRKGLVALWALVALIVLFAGGLFGALVLTGKIDLGSAPITTPSPGETLTPDTSFTVVILNASPDQSAEARATQQLVGAGWSGENLLTLPAAQQDFAETTVYYPREGDRTAARALAAVVGAKQVALNDIYYPGGDAKQLVLVIGKDFGAN